MARMRDRAARQSAKRPHKPSSPTPITPSKRDKRQIKHSLLLSRVTKNSSAKRSLRRNRKAKPAQLSADLSALVDALPHAAVDGNVVSGPANLSQVRVALVGGKSIKSRPGLQRRREAVGKAERDRFARNLAVMAAGSKGDREKKTEVQEVGKDKGLEASVYAPTTEHVGAGDERAERWAALRNHIQLSMAAQGQS